MNATSPSGLLAETTKAQQQAANPSWSAFVSANAGSGKTRVLTNRVARLLLAGIKPSKILCITFTKAAAAEMAERLFKLLGAWALADDDDLRDALDALEGEDARMRDAAELGEARRLFARALETPGGLKIQTIHSFCESVLKRFPIEAGVAPGFSVIEETETAAIINAAIDKVAARAANAGVLGEAFDRLNRQYTSDKLRMTITEAVLKRSTFRSALETGGGWQALRMACAEALGAATDADPDQIRADAMAGLKESDLENAYEALNASGPNAQKRAAIPIRQFLSSDDAGARWHALTKLFLTGAKPRKDIGDNETDKIDPAVRPYLTGKQSEFMAAHDRVLTASAYRNTDALYTILEQTFAALADAKAARAGLDYDDLIALTRRLFSRGTAAWVMFKLDQGLDHILLDESQDTSPDQWDVVEGPLEEFFAGAGARENPGGLNRTFFAVGDQKQSIYSFQGADAGLFAEKQQDLGKRFAAAAFKNIPMRLSFRTTAPVLQFVDALFHDKSVLEGVSNDAVLRHDIHRQHAAGLVELWPLTPKPEKPEARPWDAPVDASSAESAETALTGKIAETVDRWITSGQMLESHDRPIRPGDIMILVQSRKKLFTEITRALGARGVAVAGADKLDLLSDPAIEDLMSYGRAALLPGDDLSLAETLKSPLFNLDEQSLYDLAQPRRGSLWAALTSRAGERPEWRRAREEIAEARRIGLHEGAFSFFSHLLEAGEPSGRRRLFARLGETSREPMGEFMRQALEFESSSPRSLQKFLAWAEANAGEVSRDLDQTGDAVRVMTVHKAKGLEANIVFLIDAHKSPRLDTPPVLNIRTRRDAAEKSAAVPVLTGNVATDCAAITSARAKKKTLQYKEYRRLLYVAATRARDRLYICGLKSGVKNHDPHNSPAPEKTWHALSEDAFARMGDEVKKREALWDGDIRQIASAQSGVREKEEKKIAAPAPRDLPLWLTRRAPPEKPRPRLSPSHLADHLEAESEQGAADAVYSPGCPADRLLRGRTLHRLLELLPGVAHKNRREAGERLLARLAGAISDNERRLWCDEVLTVLNDERFAPAFGPNSRAEIALAGVLTRDDENADAAPLISGQIDRLAVEPDRILAIDYKTNRPPPAKVEDIPLAYLAQMAAYRQLLRKIWPDRRVETALLWTYEARLTALPDDLLDAALNRALIMH